MTNRRDFLKNSAALAAGAAAATTLPGCGAPKTEPHTPIPYKPGEPIPWVNWAGNQACLPANRFAPSSEDELVNVLTKANGVVRPVGAGHSFSAVVPTDDALVSTDLMSGLISHNSDTLEAEIWAGTRMHAVGALLESVDQALPNMPDMNYPAMGGAIATSVHATGKDFGSMSSYVTGLTLATPSGELIECSRDKNPEVFHAARTSVGALGIVTRLRLQNQKPFELTEFGYVGNTDEVLETFMQSCDEYRHFEFLPIPFANKSLVVATRLAQPGDANQGDDDPHAVNTLRAAYEAIGWIPGVGDYAFEKTLDMVMANEAATIRTGKSFEVFPHERIVRFREMEYSVPIEVGIECVAEILETIKKKKLPLYFPLEYRVIDEDDIWLSMYEGGAKAAISVHQYGDLDYKAPFAEIEPIFWKYGGRPHWGKIHTLGEKQLAELYPHWQDFQQVRRELDPTGKMLNAHLTTLFGA